jgi:hypothetical protein
MIGIAAIRLMLNRLVPALPSRTPSEAGLTAKPGLLKKAGRGTASRS